MSFVVLVASNSVVSEKRLLNAMKMLLAARVQNGFGLSKLPIQLFQANSNQAQFTRFYVIYFFLKQNFQKLGNVVLNKIFSIQIEFRLNFSNQIYIQRNTVMCKAGAQGVNNKNEIKYFVWKNIMLFHIFFNHICISLSFFCLACFLLICNIYEKYHQQNKYNTPSKTCSNLIFI